MSLGSCKLQLDWSADVFICCLSVPWNNRSSSDLQIHYMDIFYTGCEEGSESNCHWSHIWLLCCLQFNRFIDSGKVCKYMALFLIGSYYVKCYLPPTHFLSLFHCVRSFKLVQSSCLWRGFLCRRAAPFCLGKCWCCVPLYVNKDDGNRNILSTVVSWLIKQIITNFSKFSGAFGSTQSNSNTEL